MLASKKTLRLGTRASRLSILQTRFAIEKIRLSAPALNFELIPFSSPGDRDRMLDLRESPPDFFTRDLDEAILGEKLDCAIHSAKDMPLPSPAGIDWFWLPWRESPEDAIVLRKGFDMNAPQILSGKFRIGISSSRREDYCRKRFPGALILPIRGDIEMRISKLDGNEYDMLIMAAAALKRLGLEERISELIPLQQMPSPDGQGALGISFRTGDELFTALRKLFLKSVVFAGAGCSGADSLTLAALKAIKICDACLYDALIPDEIQELIPKNAIAIRVGKRLGAHEFEQDEINALVADLARQGKSVLRLKGGDPGIFGRLAEETESLDLLSIPYRVIPGVSSLSAASTGTGLLLTRRGRSRGFHVKTLRTSSENASLNADKALSACETRAFFMGVNQLPEIMKNCLNDGIPPEKPVSIVLDAGRASQKIISCELRNLNSPALLSERDKGLPGIVIVGDAAHPKYIYKGNGALQGKKVLLLFSRTIMDEAVSAVNDHCGIPLRFPTASFRATADIAEKLGNIFSADWITASSPTSVEILVSEMKERGLDIRKLPKILACGSGTSAKFAEFGIFPDAQPNSSFCREAMIETAIEMIPRQSRIVVLSSEKAKSHLKNGLINTGFAHTSELVIYESFADSNIDLPPFDAAVFGSPSAAEDFIRHYGAEILIGKPAAALGKKTSAKLAEHGIHAPCPMEVESARAAVSVLAAIMLDNLGVSLSAGFRSRLSNENCPAIF